VKKINMHLHVVGRGRDIEQVYDQVFFYPEDNNTLLTSVLCRPVEKYHGKAGADFNRSGTIDTDEYLTLIYNDLSASKEIDGVVLLGLDALYDPKSGQLDEKKTALWGDTSAFSLMTRIPLLPEILETFPPEWLVHGSDFPIPIEGWVHLPGFTHDVTWEEYKHIKDTENLLDKDVMIKRAHGFSDSILENAEKVLPLRQE